MCHTQVWLQHQTKKKFRTCDIEYIILINDNDDIGVTNQNEF